MTNYNKGRAFEYKVKQLLEERGFYVVRSAGSHGIVDLVAIGKEQVNLVQCKSDGRISPADRDCLSSLTRLMIDLVPVLAVNEKGKVRFEIL